MKGHQKRAIYVQITVSLRLCRALLSTNGQGKSRRPGGLESAVNLGKLIHCALRLSVGRRRAELQSVVSDPYQTVLLGKLGKLICCVALSVGRRRAELQSVKQSCKALTVGTTPKKRPYYKAVQKHTNWIYNKGIFGSQTKRVVAVKVQSLLGAGVQTKRWKVWMSVKKGGTNQAQKIRHSEWVLPARL